MCTFRYCYYKRSITTRDTFVTSDEVPLKTPLAFIFPFLIFLYLRLEMYQLIGIILRRPTHTHCNGGLHSTELYYRKTYCTENTRVTVRVINLISPLHIFQILQQAVIVSIFSKIFTCQLIVCQTTTCHIFGRHEYF